MIAEDPRSPLVRDARALLHRAVEAVAKANVNHHHTRELLSQSMERVIWSDHLIGESARIRDLLRDTVSALAILERAKGMSPERVLVLLKGLVVDAEAEKLEPVMARSLTDDVVRWGIEAYYDGAA
jgi:hypothetical protein